MGRIFILEGPDGGGKTTLAKNLAKQGFTYKHEGLPPSGVDLISHYLKILNDSVESTEDTVHDRLWLGERIYGPICRGIDRLGDEGQVLFNRIHSSKSILHAVCLPPFEVALESYSFKIMEKSDYLKSMNKWKEVYKAYDNWIQSNVSRITIKFDYTTHDSLWLNELGIFPRGMVGSPRAKFLFIGDQPNHETIDVPFHALNGSSGYFNKALVMAGIEESDLAISNAYGPRGRDFHALGSILKCVPYVEKIFLLGNEAVKWFNSDLNTGVSIPCKVYSLPHPSYLKRFKGNNPQIMANAIRKALDGSSD